ncbi:hypothetical protein G3O06_44775 [Burkholderia sp. Ac-20345]|uniref:hypothetical protein n=1 Tax=Burkholderia sp. Ac-20345 TaxID=2703891 RepID=UPI00197B8C21|nr:hypothetical protein [Burkholderia sp. Ac-20345]MBN3784575.1 hypothetical protein [Burkholderia sp. Ac-20345]
MRARQVGVLLVALCLVGRAYAGTVIVFDGKGNIVGNYYDPSTRGTYGKIQAETSGLIYENMANRGVAVSSSQAVTTIEAVEAVAVGAASGARSGIGGGWIGMVAGLVIGAVVQGAVMLGLDKALSWLFGSNGQVTVGGSGGASVPGGVGLSSGGSALVGNFGGETLAGGGVGDFASHLLQRVCQGQVGSPISSCSVSTVSCAPGCVEIDRTIGYDDGRPNNTQAWTTFSVSTGTWSGDSCSGIAVNGACTPFGPTTITDGSQAAAPVSVASAVAAIPSTELKQPVNPQLVADTANGLWQQASQQPGYQGVPYDPSNPITADDATGWQTANPDWTPTVADGVGTGSGAGSLGSASGGGSVGAMPVSGQPGSQSTTPGATSSGSSGSSSSTTVTQNPDGSTSTTVTTNTPSCGGPGQPPCEVDWGSYAGSAQPSLESTPTIAMILGPIMNMLPGFKGFQMPAHTGVCPTGTFSMFGHSYTMDQHCTLFEQNRPAIGAAFALVFLLASVFIVLTA